MSRKSDVRRSFNERLCFVCGRKILETQGVYFAHLRVLICQGSCSEYAHTQERDYSASKKGRWRTPAKVLEILRKYREIYGARGSALA